MSSLPENSGSSIFQRRAHKFGIVIIGIIFVALLAVGVLLLVDRNRKVQQSQDTESDTGMVEGLLTAAEKEIQVTAATKQVEEVDSKKFQAVATSDGNVYVGKVTKSNEKSLTIEPRSTAPDPNNTRSIKEPVEIELKEVNVLRNLKNLVDLEKITQGLGL